MEAIAPNRRTRFGAFEVDSRSGELYKHGIRLKLQDQPFQVLTVLLEHPGEVVPREDLRQKLWPADTFVDFDTGLNSAIKKLRDTLGDSAEEPPRKAHRSLRRRASGGLPSHQALLGFASITPIIERVPTWLPDSTAAKSGPFTSSLPKNRAGTIGKFSLC
jgi:Transcriptional regulatory protein, C terminal